MLPTTAFCCLWCHTVPAPRGDSGLILRPRDKPFHTRGPVSLTCWTRCSNPTVSGVGRRPFLEQRENLGTQASRELAVSHRKFRVTG